MPRPYFYTWSKQASVDALKLSSVDGPYLITSEGHTLADLSSVSFQACFGMQHPHISRKIKQQLENFSVAHPNSDFELKEEATQRLLSYLNIKESGRIFYTLSGAESVENALKIARQLSQKEIVLARRNSYHGATLGALSVTGDWRNQEHKTVDEWTARIPEPLEDPDLSITRKIIQDIGPEKICAFCLETVTGGNGVFMAPDSWWQGIEKLCQEFNIMLIADEVICGLHRTGHPLAITQHLTSVDFICMAKGITGGMIPFGALWVNEKHAQRYDQELIFSQGLTSYAHPLGLAAMEGVLDLLHDEEFLENYHALTTTFHRELETLAHCPHVQQVRKTGLLAAIDLKCSVTLQALHRKELHAIVKEKRIVLAPAFNYTPEQMEDHLRDLHFILESL